jgi:hypothetical protein
LIEARGILVLVALSLIGSLTASVLGRTEVPAVWDELWPVGRAALSLSSHFGLALAAMLTARRMYLDASDQLPASESEPASAGGRERSWNLLAPLRWLNFTRWSWPRFGRSRSAQTGEADRGTTGKTRSGSERKLKIVAAESKAAPAASGSTTGTASAQKSPASTAPAGASKDQRPGSAPPTVRVAPTTAASTDDDEDDDEDESGISRSERRRLRKEKRRQQSRAA